MAAEIAAFRVSMVAGNSIRSEALRSWSPPENRALDDAVLTRVRPQDPILQIVSNRDYGNVRVPCGHCNIWHNFVTLNAPSQSTALASRSRKAAYNPANRISGRRPRT